MSSMTMDMSRFAVEYGDEVLNAGWIPVLFQHLSDVVDRTSKPRNLPNVDVDTFLPRMYENQR